MKRNLLDVSVLIALLWPRHQGHSAARSWFLKWGHEAWATNPITQLGAVRLLTNPAVTNGGIRAAEAVEALRELTSEQGHEFWPLDRKWPQSLPAIASKVQSYRQWTDLSLLRQAVERDALLVTFDQGLKSVASPDWSTHLLILKC